MVDHIDDDIAETIPTRQRKTQPVNWDRVPAFNSILHRDALLAYMRALPDTVAARVWITDALGTEDLGLSRACDLLDPILPCFVQTPTHGRRSWTRPATASCASQTRSPAWNKGNARRHAQCERDDPQRGAEQAPLSRTVKHTGTRSRPTTSAQRLQPRQPKYLVQHQPTKHTQEIHAMYQKTVIVGQPAATPRCATPRQASPSPTSRSPPPAAGPTPTANTQEKTTWYKVTCWRKLAEIAAQYIRKGKLILVEGDVEASAFTGRDGEARATLELTATQHQVPGRTPRNDAGESEGESNVPEIGGDDPIPF